MQRTINIMEEMRTEKERETRLDDIRNLMDTLKLSVEQAMDALRIPLGDRLLLFSQQPALRCWLRAKVIQ